MGVFGLLFGFQGRIKRSQWWLGQLALLGAVVVVFIFWCGALAGWMASKGLTGEKLKEASTGEQLQVATSFIVMFAVIALVVMWMGFALAIKRLHDRGKSGWWVLAYGVPGSLAVLMSSRFCLSSRCAPMFGTSSNSAF